MHFEWNKTAAAEEEEDEKVCGRRVRERESKTIIIFCVYVALSRSLLPATAVGLGLCLLSSECFICSLTTSLFYYYFV